MQRVLGKPDPSGNVHDREASLDELLDCFCSEPGGVLLVADKHSCRCHQLWPSRCLEESGRSTLGDSIPKGLIGAANREVRSGFGKHRHMLNLLEFLINPICRALA